MAEYIKKIAVIRGIKSGFSADGGALSGVVRAESFAGFLKVEVSLINFAPLEGGRYVLGITDGKRDIVFDGCSYEGESDFDLSGGFACIICFSDGVKCSPVASACGGSNAHLLPSLKKSVALAETGAFSSPRPRGGSQQAGEKYDDEAIAESNYYENATSQDGGAVCPPEGEKEEGQKPCKDEEVACPLPRGEGKDMPAHGCGEEGKASEPLYGAGFARPTDFRQTESAREWRDGLGATAAQPQPNRGGAQTNSYNEQSKSDRAQPTPRKEEQSTAAQPQSDAGGAQQNTDSLRQDFTDGGKNAAAGGKANDGGQSAADGERGEDEQTAVGQDDYYRRTEKDIESVFAGYPAEENLERAIEGSRWAKIPFGKDRYYVFGVIYSGGKAGYICYGVPSSDGRRAPESMRGSATYLPVGDGGYWILYQHAGTGRLLKPGEVS